MASKSLGPYASSLVLFPAMVLYPAMALYPDLHLESMWLSATELLDPHGDCGENV